MSHSKNALAEAARLAASNADYKKKLSLEMDPDMILHDRNYPSVAEYYMANSKDDSKPIQLQNGLSNFSALKLGDDRISFNESILTGSYRVAVEDKMTIPSPSKDVSVNFRTREYKEANEKVGEVEINRLERVMKDKLFQRSYETSSPFQVRKAFKFFDREQAGRIPIEGFTRALEFLGFQFSERQNIALFGRYDQESTGEIDYMNFIAKAMFYGADDWLPVPKTLLLEKKRKEHQAANAAKVTEKAIDPAEAKLMLEAELRTVFNKAATDSSGLTKDQFEVFLMAINHHIPSSLIDAYLIDMGIKVGEKVPFDLFFDWWQSDVGKAARFYAPEPDRSRTTASSHHSH